MKTITIDNSRSIPHVRNHFAGLNWCLKATGKDKALEGMAGTILSDDGILICTDGSRMHLYRQDTEMLSAAYVVPNGLWVVVSKSASAIVLGEAGNKSFPGCWAILDGPSRNLGKFRPKGSEYDYASFLFGLARLHKDCFRSDLIQDAMMPCEEYRVDLRGRMLVFGSDTFIAALMPYREEAGGMWTAGGYNA